MDHFLQESIKNTMILEMDIRGLQVSNPITLILRKRRYGAPSLVLNAVLLVHAWTIDELLQFHCERVPSKVI